MSQINTDEIPRMNLDSINSPEDLKKLSREELPALADELRQFVLDSVS